MAGRKRGRGRLLVLPGGTSKSGGEQRKLSEIVKEMADRLLKDPAKDPSPAAAHTSLALACTAWNRALGDSSLDAAGDRLASTIIARIGSPWEELTSSDSDGLIAELVEYKRARYPGDTRRIVSYELTPDDSHKTAFNARVRVHWTDQPSVAPAGNQKPLEPAAAKKGPSRPIAAKLVKKLNSFKNRKVVDFRAEVEGRALAGDMQKTVVTLDTLKDFHPAHAAYVYAQNQASAMAEQLAALPEMKALAKMIAEAEDLYMPSGPPISPLTGSYFTCWSLFDACAGPGSETLVTTVLEVGANFGMNSELLRVIGLMQDSRMGLYVHEGTKGGLAVLREFVTGTECRAIVPAGYLGRKGEIWYVRVLPPPLPGSAEWVVFTTPYIVIEPGRRDWEAYFQRTLPQSPPDVRLDAYKRHMKHGPARDFWNEYVFEAYVNYRKEVILLAGLPDVPESRPHSKVNDWRW
jgi:hypothetical protein